MPTAPQPARSRTSAAALLLLAGTGVVAALVVMLPIAFLPGWPDNHDGYAFASRIGAIAGQWRAGNWLPVWSSVQQMGHGSPMPGLYHKLFMYVSAAAFLLFRSVKAAMVTALTVFAFAAFLGAALATRRALGGRYLPLQILTGWLVIQSGYATTEWLTRGAFAEFSGLAVLCWLFAWAVAFIRSGVWSLWLGPLMALMLLAHGPLALFTPLLVAIAVAGAWMVHGPNVASWAARGAASVAVAFLLSSPFFMPVFAFRDYIDGGALISTGLTPRETLIPVSRYFWDSEWIWGDRWQGFSARLDLYAIPVLIAAAAIVIRAGLSRNTETRERAVVTVLAFLLACFAAYTFLLTTMALPIFDAIPGLIYLQFSWRLATVLVVSLAMMAALTIAFVWADTPSRTIRGAVAIAGIAMAILPLGSNLLWSGLRYGGYSDRALRLFVTGDYWSTGEFMPRRVWDTGTPSKRELATLLLSDPNPRCIVRTLDAPRRELAARIFYIDCDDDGEVVLPLFLAPGMRFVIADRDGSDRRVADAGRTCADPRARIAVEQGRSIVTVTLPNWTRLARTLWRVEGNHWRIADCVARR